MTALATVFALLPMALGVTGQGGFITQPPAVVVIDGLVTSTLLILLILFRCRRSTRCWSCARSGVRRSGPRRRAAACRPQAEASDEPESAKV